MFSKISVESVFQCSSSRKSKSFSWGEDARSNRPSSSTIISQLVYSFGGSGFAGANGSMMIEVVVCCHSCVVGKGICFCSASHFQPFFHILASKITRELGEENVSRIVSTTIVAFALSSVLTGLTFFLLGYLRLGVVIGFFPRHILVGCIGGVGVFLIQTGLVISVLSLDLADFMSAISVFRNFD